MVTVPYNRIFRNVYNLIGVEYETAQLTDWRMIRDFINSRYDEFWDAAKWPCSVRTQERSIVISGGSQGDYIENVVPGFDDIYEVYGVYNRSPWQYGHVKEVDHRLSEYGIQLLPGHGLTTAWVYFKTRKPELFGESHSLTSTYLEGEQVYFESSNSGDFYTALEDIDAGDSPEAHPAGWRKEVILEEARNFLIFAAYSDYLRHNGDTNQAALEEQKAQSQLNISIDGLLRKQGHIEQLSVRTY